MRGKVHVVLYKTFGGRCYVHGEETQMGGRSCRERFVRRDKGEGVGRRLSRDLVEGSGGVGGWGALPSKTSLLLLLGISQVQRWTGRTFPSGSFSLLF